MRDGVILGRPPVNLARSAANATLGSMLRGASYYAGAAGAGAPLAMPALQGGLPATPSNPNANPELTLLYPPSMSLAKQQLRQQFGIQ